MNRYRDALQVEGYWNIGMCGSVTILELVNAGMMGRMAYSCTKVPCVFTQLAKINELYLPHFNFVYGKYYAL